MWSLGFENKLKEMYAPFNIKFSYFLFGKSQSYVSEKITDETIENWKKKNPVFISAQTGTGKNYFTCNALMRKLAQKNIKKNKHKKILILSNRRALIEQTEKEIGKYGKRITGDWKKIVEVCSYQSFLNSISKFDPEEIKYVVLDECHFFVSDAEFNPYTFNILQTVISQFRKSVRIYMSATMEEVAYPILELESKYDDTEDFSCYYYYFERNYNYIEKICSYDDLNVLSENIVEQITAKPNERWLIFVSSKKDGKNLITGITSKDDGGSNSQKTSKDKISCVFLTAESKNASETSQQHLTYREIVENEKFSPQVLISTSVLDNGINIKDRTVKNVVVDVFDKTEMIQMLGRIRVEQGQTINLYLRNYSVEDIRKFLIDDVRKMIFRLRTDFVSKRRHEYYDKLLIESEYQYKMWHLFYHTGKKDQVFDYNNCAIYRLINRLTEFINMMMEITDEDYYIDPEDLGTLCEERSGIFEKYAAKKQKRYSKYWKRKILRILEIEENTHKNSISKVLDYTLENYLNILIPEQYSKLFLSEKDEDEYPSCPEMEIQKNMVDLKDNNPILWKQMEWLGIDVCRCLEIEQLQEKSTSNLPNVTDEELAGILNTLSIPQEEYLEHTNNETKSSKSDGTEYIPFNDKDLLEKKGIRKSKINSILKTTNVKQQEEQSIGNVEKFVKLIHWIKNKIELKHSKKLLEDIVGHCDSQSFEIGSESYKLKIVRGTQRGFQNDYAIVVKWTKTM